MTKKILSSMLFVGVLMGQVACQKSDSSKSGDQGGGSTPDVFKKELDSCRSQTIKPKLVGKWHAMESSEGFNSDSIIEFTATAVELTSRVEREGTVCEVSGFSGYQDRITAFTVLRDVKASNSQLSSDGQNELNCDVNMPAGTYKYSFNGGCLVVTTPGGNYELAPVQEAKVQPPVAQPPVNEPNQPSQPTPTLPPVVQPPAAQPPVAQPPTPPVAQPTQPKPGFPAAVTQACNSFEFASQKALCFDRLSNLKEVDDSVAKACLSFDFASEKQNCLQRIGTVKILQSAVGEICNAQEYRSQRQSCLQKFDQVLIDERFIEVCRAQDYDSQKISCLYSHKVN